MKNCTKRHRSRWRKITPQEPGGMLGADPLMNLLLSSGVIGPSGLNWNGCRSPRFNGF
jgi:hypothetical protein